MAMFALEEAYLRPFTAARHRFVAAETHRSQRDELSTMLHHLFRLIDVCGGSTRIKREPVTTATALVVYREIDLRVCTSLSTSGGRASGYQTALPQSLVWSAPPSVASDPRFVPFGTGGLVGLPCLDTIIIAFAEMLRLRDRRFPSGSAA